MFKNVRKIKKIAPEVTNFLRPLGQDCSSQLNYSKSRALRVTPEEVPHRSDSQLCSVGWKILKNNRHFSHFARLESRGTTESRSFNVHGKRRRCLIWVPIITLGKKSTFFPKIPLSFFMSQFSQISLFRNLNFH